MIFALRNLDKPSRNADIGFVEEVGDRLSGREGVPLKRAMKYRQAILDTFDDAIREAEVKGYLMGKRAMAQKAIELLHSGATKEEFLKSMED